MNNKEREPLNPMPDGSCRTIKSTYYKTSKANYERSGSMGATGVIDFNGRPCRIRKLTPLECYRLMGFTDEQFIKAATLNPSDENTELMKMLSDMTGMSISGLLADREKKSTMSNSQLYKQAGNSIVVDVFMHLLESVRDAIPSAFVA